MFWDLFMKACKIVYNNNNVYNKTTIASLNSNLTWPCFCRLNADEQIQMVTALALQLIQCVVKLPQLEDDQQPEEPEQVDSHGRKKKKREGHTIELIIQIADVSIIKYKLQTFNY